MNTWLSLLPLEIHEISSFIEPTEEVKEGETVVGQVSEELKALYTMYKTTAKSADLLSVERNYRKITDEESAKISELKFKARALEMLFWVGINDEHSLWGHVAGVDVRVGWRVVEFKLPQMPVIKLFNTEI